MFTSQHDLRGAKIKEDYITSKNQDPHQIFTKMETLKIWSLEKTSRFDGKIPFKLWLHLNDFYKIQIQALIINISEKLWKWL